jgi:hypothetical protein
LPGCAHGKQLASTLTTFDAFIKERYTTEKIEDLTMSDRPLWAQTPKGSARRSAKRRPQRASRAARATSRAGNGL